MWGQVRTGSPWMKMVVMVMPSVREGKQQQQQQQKFPEQKAKQHKAPCPQNAPPFHPHSRNTPGGCLHGTDVVGRTSQVTVSPSAWLGLWTHSRVRMFNGRRALLPATPACTVLSLSLQSPHSFIHPSRRGTDAAESYTVFTWPSKVEGKSCGVDEQNKPTIAFSTVQKPNSSSVSLALSCCWSLCLMIKWFPQLLSF